MDSFLIDFDSPKERRDDAPLISQGMIYPTLFPNSPVPFSVTAEESNPFDLVDCQAAAHSAAENDPFEMVLNDAINFQDSFGSRDDRSVSSEATKPLHKNSRKSISLPDLRQSPEVTSHAPTDASVSSNSKFSNESSITKALSNSAYLSGNDGGNADCVHWSCLDDIPPPDSLLNATVDMSCFLDDTLPSNSPILPHAKPISSKVLQNLGSSSSNGFESISVVKDLKATNRSEDELKLLAQKKIENIINKAELEVSADIKNSNIMKRLSLQNLSEPSQEAVAACCTPRRYKDVTYNSSPQSSWSFKKWSEDELLKLDLILPDSTLKVPDFKKASSAYDIKKDIALLEETANLNSEKMPIVSSTLQVTPQKGKMSGMHVSPDGKVSKPCTSVLSSPSSPVLRALPLCEDAVRNLSLCSKYSPEPKEELHEDKIITGSKVMKNIASADSQEKDSKQSRLILRKSAVPPKVQSKMAPMKATAPVQDMTRSRSSLLPAAKSEASARRSVLKETSVKPVATSHMRAYSRLPQSPGRASAGSLPNLPTQGSKGLYRPPSPRKPTGMNRESLHLKCPTETPKGRNTPQGSSSFHPSPRPLRKSSPGRGGSQPRVLTEINSCSNARKLPKRRISQLEGSKRDHLILNEKENLL